MDILLVEDEISIRDVLKAYFTNEGWRVHETGDGRNAIQVVQNFKLDLVVLDLMIGSLSGEEVCRNIRRISRVPIMIITSKAKETDIISGLSLGADDYITKPFRIKEVIARIFALKRRMDMFASDNVNDHYIKRFNRGCFVVNFTTEEVLIYGKPAHLTHTEFKLLALLMKNPGKIYGRNDLSFEVHGYRNIGFGRTMDMHIKNIRSKIEKNPKNPDYIVTKIGAGYKFNFHSDEDL